MVFSGSLRQQSFNTQLARFVTKILEQEGTEVQTIELNDYPLPLFNQDNEDSDGIHANALTLKQKMNTCDGFIICSPEYNGSFSAALKNMIDWCSRQAEGESILQSFQNKQAAILSASPGALGGLRGLTQLRALLNNIGVHVIPDQIAIGKAHEAFTEEGQLDNEKQANKVTQITKKLLHHIAALKAYEPA